MFEAAAGIKRNHIEGVSECIIMGQTMSAGTGAFRVVRRLGLRDGVDVKKLQMQIEDLWEWESFGEERGSQVRNI